MTVIVTLCQFQHIVITSLSLTHAAWNHSLTSLSSMLTVGKLGPVSRTPRGWLRSRRSESTSSGQRQSRHPTDHLVIVIPKQQIFLIHKLVFLNSYPKWTNVGGGGCRNARRGGNSHNKSWDKITTYFSPFNVRLTLLVVHHLCLLASNTNLTRWRIRRIQPLSDKSRLVITWY